MIDDLGLPPEHDLQRLQMEADLPPTVLTDLAAASDRIEVALEGSALRLRWWTDDGGLVAQASRVDGRTILARPTEAGFTVVAFERGVVTGPIEAPYSPNGDPRQN